MSKIFNGKNVILIDDGIDTGGTLRANFENITNADKRIVYATHAWLAGDLPDDSAQDILLDSNIDVLIFGNTHPDRVHTISDDLLNNKVIFIDYSKYFADAIINCVSKGIDPNKHYSYKNLDELLKKAGHLYDVIDKRIN